MRHALRKMIFGKHSLARPTDEKYVDKRLVNIKAIWENEHHDDFGLEKILRLFLVATQFLFPVSNIKYVSGRYGERYKDLSVDLLILLKLGLPLLILISGLEHVGWLVWLQVYIVSETILYIPALVFASDIYSKPSSYRRSMFLVFLNYIEIILAFAVFYASGPHLNQPSTYWFDTVYFSFTTATSLGYGDLHPISLTGRVLVTIQGILFILFVVIFLNFFTSKVEGKGYFQE